jgi:hypothetical protein
MRKQLRLGFRALREAPLDQLRDAGVQLLAAIAQERAVGRVLYQRVLEGVGCLRRSPAREDEPRRLDLRERGRERLGL